MATDYWVSSHNKKWIVDRLALFASRVEDLRFASPEHLSFLNIFFANLITKIGKKLHFRQRVIATATVFFRRFYLKNSLCDTEPYIVLVACCYLAGKAEELPAHIKTVITVANNVLHDLNVWSVPLDNHRLAEMEFYLVDELECDLTVFHPYRSLLTLCGKETEETTATTTAPATAGTAGQTQGSRASINSTAATEPVDHTGHGVASGERYWGTGAGKLLLDDRTLQLTWLIINDTYRTDVCLLYPPFLIAVAAIFLSLVNHDRVLQPATANNLMEAQTTDTFMLEATPFGAPTPSIGATPSFAASTPATVTHITGPTTTNTTTPTVNPDPITFLANLNVSMNTVSAIVQDMLSFYTLSSRYVDDTAMGAATPSGAARQNRATTDTTEVNGLAMGPGNGVSVATMMEGIQGGSSDVVNGTKVRARQLVDLLRRMRIEKERENEGASMGSVGNMLISPVSSIPAQAGGGQKGGPARSGQPVNKRLERAQAVG
ncbi:RNA polymerase II holoenzyme cyclin-like subunit [Serendipita sp. 405]|nr:RNA polymerase II holoenzyme cyclin-like subunit [Serendipita sp. 405]